MAQADISHCKGGCCRRFRGASRRQALVGAENAGLDDAVKHIAWGSGSLDSGGPAVAAGMLFVNSGYGQMIGMSGNVLRRRAVGADGAYGAPMN